MPNSHTPGFLTSKENICTHGLEWNDSTPVSSLWNGK